jgi:hypothetical protein
MARATEQDRVRELQRALCWAAKADPKRRFHALYDKVHRRDVLERAWGSVRANRGAAGIDRTTIADVERYAWGARTRPRTESDRFAGRSNMCTLRAGKDVQKRHDQEQPPEDGKSDATPIAAVGDSATHDRSRVELVHSTRY